MVNGKLKEEEQAEGEKKVVFYLCRKMIRREPKREAKTLLPHPLWNKKG